MAVVIVLLSIGASIWSALRPLDQGGLGADTYGTRANGSKAVFDILDELDLSAERALVPFGDWVDHKATYVVWAPDDDLVSVEPAYAKRLAEWVRAGGRVVVAPPPDSQRARLSRRSLSDEELVRPTTLLKELGLDEIVVRTVSAAPAELPADHDSTVIEDLAGQDDWSGLREAWQRSKTLNSAPTQQLPIEAHGNLQPLGKSVARLELPQKVQVLELHKSAPVGRVTFKLHDQDEVLVASYRLGKGTAIVVSEPKVFENRLIARADNPVLAAHLLAGDGNAVVWDEFYHGLTVRANPWFLLTRGRYAVLALMIVATTVIWIWRHAVFLGPPLAPQTIRRRSIAEYVEAMARLFQRSRQSNSFVLRTVTDGVLWWQRHHLGLKAGQENVEAVSAALARRDPAAARRLLDAVSAADVTLARESRLSHGETLQSLKKLAKCL